MEYEVEELFKNNSVFQLKELAIDLESELIEHEEKLQNIVKNHKFSIIQSGKHLKKLGMLSLELNPIDSRVITTAQPKTLSPESVINNNIENDEDMVDCTKVRLLLDLSEQLFNLLESDQVYESALALKFSINLYNPELNTQFPFIISQWDTITNFVPTINEVSINNISKIHDFGQFKNVYELVVGWCLNMRFSGSLGLSGWLEVKTSQLIGILENFNQSIANEATTEVEIWDKISKLIDHLLTTLVYSIYYTVQLFINHSKIFWPIEFHSAIRETYNNLINSVPDTEFIPSNEYDIQISDILPPTALHHLIKRLPNQYHTISIDVIKDQNEALSIDWFDEFIDNWIDETLKRIRNDSLLTSLSHISKYPNLIPASFNKFRELTRKNTEKLFKSMPSPIVSPTKRTKLEQTIFDLEARIWNDMLLPPLLKSSEIGLQENLSNNFKSFNNNLIDQLNLVNNLTNSDQYTEDNPESDDLDFNFNFSFKVVDIEFKSIDHVKSLLKSSIPMSNYYKFNNWLIQLKSNFEKINEMVEFVLVGLEDNIIRVELTKVIISQRIELVKQLINHLQMCIDNSEFKLNFKLNCELSKLIQLIKKQVVDWSSMDNNKIEFNKLIHKLEQQNSISYRKWIHSTSNWFLEKISYLFQSNPNLYDDELSDPNTISSMLYQSLTGLNYLIWENWKIYWNETIRSSLFREIYHRTKLELQTSNLDFNQNLMDYKFLSYLIYQGEKDNSLPKEIKFSSNDLESSRLVLKLVKGLELSISYCINSDKLNYYCDSLSIGKDDTLEDSGDWIPISIPAAKFPLLD